jgi:hypothetical protein
MAACESCGKEKPENRNCNRCGFPALTGDASRLMAEAADLAEVGQADQALHKIQQAAKLSGDSWIPRLKLGQIFEAKAMAGNPGLQRLADREFSEAMRLGPLERDVHAARIERVARRGGLALLRAEYTEKLQTLPVAAECLRMIDALEQAARVAGAEEPIPPPAENYRAKMFLVSCVLAALGTFTMLIKMIMMNRAEFDYVFVGGLDFWVALVFLTSSMVLGLEFLRASGKLKKK